MLDRYPALYGLHLFEFDQVTGADERSQIDIGDATDLYIVQRKRSFNVSATGATGEIGIAQVGAGLIDAHAEVCPAARVRELDKDITHFSCTFLKLRQGGVRAADRDILILHGETLNEIAHGDILQIC